MIDFHPIRISDKKTIEQYTLHSQINNCDLAFTNMFCWESVYRSAWAVVNDFLVIRFHIDGGEKIGYMQPVGVGDFAHIIPELREDAHKNGQRLRIIGITDQGRDMIRAMHIGLFSFVSNRNMEDYIYNTSDLQTLTGKRYQPKRNHINRFESQFDYRYEELTHKHFDVCMRLEIEWRKEHVGHHLELSAEQRAMRRAFDNFDALGLRGGCIFVDNELVAFTYGSAVNDHTFVIHVEKADTDYDGAFTIINKLFAEHLPAQYTLINREEDLGIEGLRHSKLSYQPAFLQHKFTAIHLHPDEIACKMLWQECFGDDDDFVDTFIMNHYKRSQMLSQYIDDELASMIHLLNFNSELGSTVYIYGVATAERFRHRGLASELMLKAMKLITEWEIDAAILIPSSEPIRNFYIRFGLDGSVPVEFSSDDNFDFGSGDKQHDNVMIWLRDKSTPLPETLHCVKQ